MAEIEKLPLTSIDIKETQLDKLKGLFPEVFTDGNKIDWDKLRSSLGESVDIGKERYGMNWPGKSDCFKTIQQPSIATLVPEKEESIDFDITQNLFIEGDNLEVLKLLQKSYLGKVKMIYIDPPYNTGNDFIYPDNFAENLSTYLEYTGQIDSEGKKFSANTETDGRFHSKWMNMMYPRLFLAKNLLKEDGVIFISIDDNEIDNLRKICTEIFGEENFIADLSVVNNLKGRNDKRYIARAHERLLMFTKSIEFEEQGLHLPESRISEYDQKDDIGQYRLLGLRKRGGSDTRVERPNMYYPFYVDPLLKKVSLKKTSAYNIEVLPKKSDGVEGRWRWGSNTSADRIDNLVAKEVGSDGRFDVFEKDYLETDGELRKINPKSVMAGTNYSTDGATKAFRALMPEIDFPNPKPVLFLKDLIAYSTSAIRGEIILDFFAGSCTTAHAVLEQNSEDNGDRKFICIQLPQKLDDKSDKYSTIADIGKERIRRSIAKIKQDLISKNNIFSTNGSIDLGFRVYKLQPSNFKIWDANVEKQSESIQKALFDHVANISPEAEQESILYELLLKSGFELTTKIEKLDFAGKPVFSVADGQLLICLDKQLNNNVIKAIAEKHPSRVICLDEGFSGSEADSLKTNAVQIMKSKGVLNFRTV